jgi:hypothetical protein
MHFCGAGIFISDTDSAQLMVGQEKILNGKLTKSATRRLIQIFYAFLRKGLTINAPVVYMARDSKSISRPIGRGGP